MPINKEEITGIECRHVQYVEGPEHHGRRDDLHVIKEVVHTKDGSRVPNLRLVKNYERSFWITKPGYRNHEQKKEWEDIDKLDEYRCTQVNMREKVKNLLGVYGYTPSLRQLASSPYLYGSDIKSTAVLKHQYLEKWPELTSACTVAVLDIETDVVEGHGEPIYVSITFKDKAILATTEAFVKDIPDFESQLQTHFQTRLADVLAKRPIQLEVAVCRTALEMIKAAIAKAHEWQPDFLAIWNMDFDIPKLLQCIEDYGGDAGDIFSDPSIPPPYRKAEYKRGKTKKITASGKEEAKAPSDMWHTFRCPATFYVIDQMCVFRKLRIAQGKEPSYALDAILRKYAGTQKLKNEKADELDPLEWHRYMQVQDKVDYAVYNLYDCISCEILDEQPNVGDLAFSLPGQIAHSDYETFDSQPGRTVDYLHYHCLKHRKVIGTACKDMATEHDSKTVSLRDWIVTLPAHMVTEEGLRCIKELPDTASMMYRNVYDLDLTAAYPSGEIIFNTSKETTVAEIINIEGVSEQQQRRTGINLTGGTMNAVEICCSVLQAPSPLTFLEDLDIHEGLQNDHSVL